MSFRVVFTGFFMALFLGATFQNCSGVNFATNASTANNVAGANPIGLVLQDGRPATNQQILTATFTNVGDPSTFSKMRLAEVSQFTTTTPWQTFNATTTVNLGTAFKGDGSLDKIKTIQAELMPANGGATTTVTAQILLDTVAPSGIPQGILLTGPTAGQVLKLNQAVDLAWSAQDVPSPLTGSMSGLDPQNAIKIGWTTIANCSQNNVTFVTGGMAPTNSYSGFLWQNASPADTFYICVYVQDVAGNVTTILSQPMTNLWTVLAGDNNPGDGGSATGAKVRFNVPYAVATDSLNDIYIADQFLNTVRVVSGQTGVITLFAGNGEAVGPAVPGDATQSPVVAPTKVAVDGLDRVYVVANGSILRMTPQITGPAQLENWLPVGIRGMTIDRTPSPTSKSGTLYLSVIGNYTITSSAAGAYILKIPIDAFDAQFTNSTATLQSLIADYVYAGTGCLDANAASDYKTTRDATSSCIDFVSALAFADANTLYFKTELTYTGSHSDIRKLVRDSAGNLENIWVATAPRGIGNQMEYITQLDANNKPVQQSLLVSTDGPSTGTGLLQYNLLTTPVSQNNIDPYAGSAKPSLVVDGVAQFQRAQLTSVPSIVVPDASNSRVATATLNNGALVLNSSFGRAVYNATDTLATQAMVNNPLGLAQDAASNFYFFEALSGIVRKVDTSGNISVLAGSPGVQVQSTATSSSFANMTFNGLGVLGGQPSPLVYSPDDNALFLAETRGIVRKLNLTTQVASLYGAPQPSAYDNWGIFSLAFSPAATSVDNKGLYVLHQFLSNTNPNGYEVKYSGAGGATETIVAGNGVGGYIKTGVTATQTAVTAIRGTVFDSLGNLYVSGAGTFKIDSSSSLTSMVNSGTFSSMILFENESGAGGGIHFIGLNGTGIYHFVVGGSSPTSASVKLCLPGTYLNGANNLIKTSDGNIALTDSSNNRVLKYFIRDTSGKLTFSNCN